MNIGIENSTGEIISILNSDDIYQNESIISEVMEQIKRTTDKDIFLGDVVYFRNTSFYDIYRYYKSKNFERWHLRIGLMPPHPPSFIRKKIYDNFGLYNTGFKIASDFEIFLRFIYVNKINFHKLNKIVVRMRMGGISGKNFQSYIISTQEILQSYKINKIKISLLIVLLRLPPKLLQYFLFSKEKLNHNYRLFKLKFGMEFLNGAFKIIKRIDQIPYEKNFILSGLNLAFLGYYFKNQIPYHESIYHWPDGLFAKSIFDNIEKIPGRQIIRLMKIPNDVKNIYVIGNLSNKNKSYLEERFNKKVLHQNAPYGSIEKLSKELDFKIPENSLVFLTLPTPKQEQIAIEMAKLNKNYKIICIGASIALASGEEKEVPKFLENYEFLWRLRTDPIRRSKRLLETMVFFWDW